MLRSSRCSDDTEGSLMRAGTEIKGRKTGIRAIRVHQNHRPSLQQQCSATDEKHYRNCLKRTLQAVTPFRLASNRSAT